MALHVIIGYKQNSNTADPHVVYAGRSGAEARAAMDQAAEKFARFDVLSNPPSYRKSGKLQAKPAAVVAEPAEPAAPAEADAPAAPAEPEPMASEVEAPRKGNKGGKR